MHGLIFASEASNGPSAALTHRSGSVSLEAIEIGLSGRAHRPVCDHPELCFVDAKNEQTRLADGSSFARFVFLSAAFSAHHA